MVPMLLPRPPVIAVCLTATFATPLAAFEADDGVDTVSDGNVS